MRSAAPSVTGPAPPSLRRRLGTVLAIAAAIGIIGFAVLVLELTRLTSTSDRLVFRLNPAAVENQQLLSSMLDQETAERGFVLTGDPSFLEPYSRGRTGTDESVARLGLLLRGEPRLQAEAVRAVADARAWQEQAVTALRSTPPSDDTPAIAAIVTQGKARFDAFRASQGALSRDLDVRRTSARAAVRSDLHALFGVVVGAAIVVTFAFAGLWVALRRLVVDPLAELRDRVARVAAGDLDAPVIGSGARELAEVGESAEEMRRRIVEELARVQVAARLVEDKKLALERSNADLEQFAYVASHDLQEPLRKVASFCQLLQKRYGGQLDERADQYIEFAVDGAKRMQFLINDLLAFSRVGRSTQTFRPVPLSDAIDLALRNLAQRIEDNDATVLVPDDLPTVNGDRTLLSALFQNLIGNAIKFRGEDSPTVRLTWRPAGDAFELAVSDDGIGIEPQFADRIFIIFQRLHAKEEYEGTGIGLAMCKKIVEFHGGDIWLDTDTKPGTTFRLTLPVLATKPDDEVDALLAGGGADARATMAATSVAATTMKGSL